MASKRTAAKLFQEDIVKHNRFGTGIVLRCSTDSHESDIDPHHAMHDPLLRPLKVGEVGVSFFEKKDEMRGMREILPETDFELIDRSFQIGDYCKHSVDDVQSGVIVSAYVEGYLGHAISGEPVGWKTLEALQENMSPHMGEYVLANDWVGQVIELFDETMVDVGESTLVRLPEISSRMSVGDRGMDVLPAPPTMQGLFGYFRGNRNSQNDTVVSVNHTGLAIAWLAFNQSLDQTTSSPERPPRFWYASQIPQLVLVKSYAESYMRVGDKVSLKDLTGVPSTTHGSAESETGMVTVQTCTVRETRTTVEVLWQDGSRETLPAKDLVPYLNPDATDTWPSEHVIYKGDEVHRPAIVQSVNAKDRTANLLFNDGNQGLVSLLELNIHGGPEPGSTGVGNESVGVRLGEFVFIHRSSNGSEPPNIPQLGEIEAWVREIPVDERGEISGWRRHFDDVGKQCAAQRLLDKDTGPALLKCGEPCHSWFGEVIATHLDGLVEVVHPDGTRAKYPISRLTKLQDGMELLEEMWDEMSDGLDDEGMWAMDEHGTWVPHEHDEDEGDWEDAGDEYDEYDVGTEDDEEEEGSVKSTMDVDGAVSEKEDPMDVTTGSIPKPGLTTAPSDTSASTPTPDRFPWKRFDILPSCPADHAFFASPPARPSKTFLSRITREYRVLAGSLPESIVVRAYEDRTDLLRCLIIGPENTPYQDAPFFIDWNLGSDFPNAPPVAHFFSFTNGKGRVNPNLYEEGKVCLSILGTWAGEINESWSAARSSLLQALVSIQGLVLVKEPWFCEPAYAGLRGLPEGTVNSRLYNEKAYILCHNFVLHSLESPLGGFEDEINFIYRSDNRLAKIIDHAEKLIATSKAASDEVPIDDELAVARLSTGGIMSLEKPLGRLRAILEKK